jgi:penicillin-binding protein 1A
MNLTTHDTPSRWDWVGVVLTWFMRMLAVAQAMAARGTRGSRYAKLRWRKPAAGLFLCTTLMTATLVGIGFYRIYLDRTNLPDLEPFVRSDFPTVGHIYDTNGQPLMEMATEYRWISKYQDIPPVVCGAILAAEDKNFFSHNGVDYSSIPRVLAKLRFKSLLGRLTKLGRRDAVNSSPIFPQGGSTITQQLVRGYFLQAVTARENSNQLRHTGLLARGLSYLIGARSVNMVVRKVEEIRLALWLEKEMSGRFGSKRRAKEEILARYVSLVYMGNGQYGLARAADYYFGRSLASFTTDDADKAALLAGAIKSARYYAPTGSEIERVRQRRNQVLGLMAANGSIVPDFMRRAKQRPIVVVQRPKDRMLQSPAIVENVLEELKTRDADLSAKDLFEGRIQVYSTADARVQQIVTLSLEHGLLLFEKRHPSAKGLIQGSVVVLKNSDASILAEAGGRQLYKDRSASYTDLNRVTQSLRQPGSAMKPIVYLAAFQAGMLNLDSVVPDEPISVPNGAKQDVKWISNYDGQFKGMIPARMALAESRNAVAIWIAGEIGIASVLRTARNLGIETPLQPYVTTALGASEVNLMELANAYRAMASGILTQPYVIQRIVPDPHQVMAESEHPSYPVHVEGLALLLIQEGMRGVVRLPTGTAHALDSGSFPIPVMGKTGTTNEFRDALFVGSSYGPRGITIAVRIGFDDNRSLGAGETGGRVALPVFREIALRVYTEKLVGPAPQFPAEMEQSINEYLQGGPVKTIAQR